VELCSATREAKEKIYGWKNRPGIRETAAKVYDKHGSRNPAREGVKRRSGVKRKPSAVAAMVAAVEDEQQGSFDF
jgi:hypothetical protein